VVSAPPSVSISSANSSGIPPIILFRFLLNTLNGLTNDCVAIPPRKPYRSIRMVLAPFRAAAIAAIRPAGPPPQTATSYLTGRMPPCALPRELSVSRLMPLPGAPPSGFAPFAGPAAAIAGGAAATASPAVAAPRNLRASRRLQAVVCFVFSLAAGFSALIGFRCLPEVWRCLPYDSIQTRCAHFAHAAPGASGRANRDSHPKDTPHGGATPCAQIIPRLAHARPRPERAPSKP